MFLLRLISSPDITNFTIRWTKAVYLAESEGWGLPFRQSNGATI
jgi:hypothetical protein